LFLVWLVPMAAFAQTPAQGPLVLERIHSPFVIAPDYKITDFDGDTGHLAGVYGGRLLDNTLFIGGGYYWLVSGTQNEEMRYGGLLVGWSMPAGSAVRFGGRGLVGFGTASLPSEVGPRIVPRPRDAFRGGPVQNVRFLAHDDFFVFEPQVNATIQLIPHANVELGGGYRVTGATEPLEGRLNGITGNVAFQLTW
jgi:hypothetical protein